MTIKESDEIFDSNDAISSDDIPVVPGLFLTSVINDSNEGRHVLTIAMFDEDGEPRTHQFFFEREAAGAVLNHDEMMETVSEMVMKLLEDEGSRIGATLRSITDTGMEVRCWNLGWDDVIAFDSQKTIEAYCVKPFTGKIVSPEPGTTYCDAWVVELP